MAATFEPAPLRDDSLRRTRKILSLDGGGVRGLSEIMILQSIMESLSFDRRVDVEPWQEFDMIVGTSTGGLLAIMLGRLRMSIADTQNAYVKFSKEIFTPKRHAANPARLYDFLQANGKFESQPLKSLICQLLADQGLSEDTLMKDERADDCKVCVCAVRGEDCSAAVLRSFQGRAHNRLLPICKVWEAARATSAASTFFDPIKIGPFGQEFVDGALRYNNPIDVAESESRELWPDDNRIIISLGTGSAPGGAVTGNLIGLARRLKDIVVEADATNERFRRSHVSLVENDRLFRFNVTQGLAEIGLEEHQSISRIATLTESYLDNSDNLRMMERCVKSMKDAGQRLNLTTPADHEENVLQESGSTMIKMCRSCLKGQHVRSIMFICLRCDTLECSMCNTYHDKTHTPFILHFISLQWSENVDGVDQVRQCWSCSRAVRSRFECTECARAICDACAEVRTILETWYSEHDKEHKSFRSISPPTRTCPTVLERDCRCVEDANVMLHCFRCLDVLKAGDTVYWCITCRNIYGGAAKYCRKCYNEELPRHKDHRSQTITFVKREPVTTELGASTSVEQYNQCWQCYDCDSVIPWSSFARHPCLNMSHVAGNALLDLFRLNNVRCPRLAEPRWPFHVLKYSWIQCSECKRMREGHPHRSHPCRMILNDESMDSQGYQACYGCHREIAIEDFAGLQCTSCRDYGMCYACMVNKKPIEHITCESRLVVWQLILPKGLYPDLKKEKTKTARFLRAARYVNPLMLVTAAVGVLAAGTMDEAEENSDD